MGRARSRGSAPVSVVQRFPAKRETAGSAPGSLLRRTMHRAGLISLPEFNRFLESINLKINIDTLRNFFELWAAEAGRCVPRAAPRRLPLSADPLADCSPRCRLRCSALPPALCRSAGRLCSPPRRPPATSGWKACTTTSRAMRLC